jgi:PTH1 family peptidyl-tRNA hydrolase
MTGDAFARKNKVAINRARFQALTASCRVGGESVLLMKPQTYMNNSGEAVAKAARFYKVDPSHVLVVSDEMSLPVGAVRVRPKGSAGGHNGLKSIIEALGTEDFPRIRLGVGSPTHADYDPKDWVLSVFRDQDAEIFAEAAGRAADAVTCYITEGADKAMNLYNRK